MDFVRLAMHRSVNTSLTWQHFWMATEATPPQPMTRTLLIKITLLCNALNLECGLPRRQRQQELPQNLAGCGRGDAAGVQARGQFVDVRADDARGAGAAHGLQELRKVTPPASGVPVPGKAEGVQAVQVDRPGTRARPARSAPPRSAQGRRRKRGAGPCAPLRSGTPPSPPLRMQNWWMRPSPKVS